MMDAMIAARRIRSLWLTGQVTDALTGEERPDGEREGYAAQRALVTLALEDGDSLVGWKIAATAAAGQRHLAVDGPIAGRLFASRCHADGAEVPIGANRFLVAEAEFAFKLGTDLAPRDAPYSRDEVVAAVETAHPAIELPDTRFADPTRAGKAQLAADDACADRFVLGEPFIDAWRERDLAAQQVELRVNGVNGTVGSGRDVLGDPCVALAWLANAHRLTGAGLARGEVVTTGVCGMPTPYVPGDVLSAEFEGLGRVEASIVA